MSEWSRFLESLTPGRLEEMLRRVGYIPGRDVVFTLWLAMRLGKPLLVEGEPGTGKTELAKSLAAALGIELIRLQCYEGITWQQALYDWDYPRQLLAIRMLEGSRGPEEVAEEIYSERYLVKGPLLRALLHKGPKPPVLLIDEVDRADEEFEAFLLEFLAEFQVTIPELGVVRAEKRPIVVLTSNRTRELGDGLRRRSLYLYVTYPPREREVEIVMTRVKGVSRRLAEQVVDAVNRIRKLERVSKKPGISESVDWAASLRELGVDELSREAFEATKSAVLKTAEDYEGVKPDDVL